MKGANTRRFGRDPAFTGFPRKIVFGGRVAFVKPQHASLRAEEEPHPDIEDFARDLEIVIEATEHEALFRKLPR